MRLTREQSGERNETKIEEWKLCVIGKCVLRRSDEETDGKRRRNGNKEDTIDAEFTVNSLVWEVVIVKETMAAEMKVKKTSHYHILEHCRNFKKRVKSSDCL